MPLPAIIEALDNVDAGLHDLYAETEDGRFALDIDGEIAGHPAVTPLENAFRKEQEKRKRQGRELEALKEQLAARRETGGDDREGGEGGKPVAAATRRRLEAAHREELSAAAGQAEKYRTALESTLVEAALTEALVAANVAAPFMKAAKAMHRGNFAVVEDDGAFQVVANVDANNGDGTGLSPDAFIAAWAASEEGRAFIAAPRNGGGAANGSGANGAHEANPWRRESFNRTEQARIAREDPALAKRLARAAGRPEPRL